MVSQRQLVLISLRVDLNWKCWRHQLERHLSVLSGVEPVIVSKEQVRDTFFGHFWIVGGVSRTHSKGEGDGSGVKLVWLLDRDAENDGMDSEMVTYSAGNRDISDTESEVQINGLLPNSSYTLRTVSNLI